MRGGLIADDRGDPVYFHPAKPKTVMDFRAGTLRGKPVLSWWEGRYVFGVGKVGDYVIVDASYRELARFSSAGHRRPDFHEVLLTDHGTLLVTAYETRAADLTAVGGPSNGLVYGGVIQELAVPSGRLLWEWRSLDHVDITETVSDQLGSPFDYFHINAIEVDGDGTPARLRPQHVRALQDRPPDGEGPLAAGRQAERLLDGQGDTRSASSTTRASTRAAGRSASSTTGLVPPASPSRSRGRSCSRSTSDAGR